MESIEDSRNIWDVKWLDFHKEIPSLPDYYRGLNGYIILAIVIGCLLFLLNFVVFLHTLIFIYKRIKQQYQLCTLILCGVYPIISAAALITILIPKSVFICHTIMYLSFTICAYVFWDLCFYYVNGKKNFLRNTKPNSLQIATLPLCCCCSCIKPMNSTQNRLCIVRYMIIQLPVFQFLIMLALNIIYFQEPNIFTNASLYFAPFMIASILIGIWGLNIVTRLIGEYLPEHNLKLKYICIQLVLVVCKLQTEILQAILRKVNFRGQYPITDTVYIQVIIQIAILIEIILVAFLAKKAYKKPIDDL